MRIGLISHQWPGARMGGIGSYVRQCAAALAAAGHEPHVFTLALPDDVRRTSVLPGVVVHEAPDLAARVHAGTLPASSAAAAGAGGEGTYRLALAWLLCDAAMAFHRHTPFDIIEAPEVEALGLPLLLDASRNVPVVTHLHCCTAIAHHAHETDGGPSGPLVRALEFAAIRMADGVCAPTRYIADVTRQFTPIAGDVRVIPHPFTCGRQPFTPPPPDGPIVFVGRVERLKGCAVLAEALNQFLPRHPAARFRFVGPDTSSAPGGGSMVDHIRRTVSADVASRVEFTGELPREQVERELQGCRFVVMPSLWENFSMAACEAMAAGRTLVVGGGTGLTEVIGDAGLVAERGSAADLAARMDALHSSRDNVDRLSRQAYDRVRSNCLPAAVARQRVAFYAETITRFRERAAHSPAQVDASAPALSPADVRAFLCGLSAIVGTLAGSRLASPPTPGSRLLAVMDLAAAKSGRPVRVTLYGAGKHTARLLAERAIWEASGHRVIGLIDDHPRFRASPTYLDLPVRSISQAAEAAGELGVVVLSTDTYEDQFWSQTAPLRDRGVAVHRLYGAAAV